jgi:hypothetical protein
VLQEETIAAKTTIASTFFMTSFFSGANKNRILENENKRRWPLIPIHRKKRTACRWA